MALYVISRRGNFTSSIVELKEGPISPAWVKKSNNSPLKTNHTEPLVDLEPAIQCNDPEKNGDFLKNI